MLSIKVRTFLDFGVPLIATSSARALVVATITLDIFVIVIGCGWDKAVVGVWNRATVGPVGDFGPNA